MLLPAAWALLLLLSFIGFGVLLRRLFFPSLEIGWANEAAWGMALVIVTGGCLNLLGLISRTLLLVVIAVGVAMALFDLVSAKRSVAQRLRSGYASLRSRPFRSALRLLGLGAIMAAVGIHYLGWVDLLPHAYFSGTYSLQDDLKGYFLFPQQMLQGGGISSDPFNNMRLQNGLGGQAILHALILAVCDYRNLGLIDGAVATLISVGLVWRIARERRFHFWWGWTLTAFFLAIPFYPYLRVNCSSCSTGMVVFLALFAFLDRNTIDDDAPVANALLVALLTTAGFALRTNLIPPLVLILVLSYLWHVVATRGRRSALVEMLLVPLFVFLMLLPWMLSLLHTSGTLLYPILGKGFDELSYGNFPADDFADGMSLRDKWGIIINVFWAQPIFLALSFAATVALLVAPVKRRATAHAFAVGSVAAVLVILLKSDLSNIGPFYRYLFVCVFISLVAVLVALLEQTTRGRGWRSISAVVAVPATVLTLVVVTSDNTLSMYERLTAYIAEGSELTMPSEPLIAEHKKAQESVPPGEAILSRDLYTLLYDSRRNRICTINDPGGCSPPPGMPYFQGGNAVADYLLSHNVRYVAYSYADQAGYPVLENLVRLRPNRPYYHRVTERAKVALDHALGELGATRKRIYDDGKIFVLDLKSPSAAGGEYKEANYFQAGKLLTLGWAKTHGFDRDKVWTYGHGVIENVFYQLRPQDNMMVLNTFGFHPWKGELDKVRLVVSVNGVPLRVLGFNKKSYYLSLDSIQQPITQITIDSATFVPRNEKIKFGNGDDRQALGIDVDTIEIADRQEYVQY